MYATSADYAAQVRRVLQQRPILAAYACDRAQTARARAFALGVREGIRLGLGEGAFALDRWHTDQLRAHDWEQEWAPRLMEAPAMLLIGEPFGRPPPQPAVAPARA